jgi:hypothetical protein
VFQTVPELNETWHRHSFGFEGRFNVLIQQFTADGSLQEFMQFRF